MPFEAEIVADSISPMGDRLTTFRLRYPKFIHGELMTHRRFSRNASSSRAVPTARLLEEVRDPERRATFVHWGKEQKGMGADTQLTGDDFETARAAWDSAAQFSARMAHEMVLVGASKQLVNRLLEPFSHINVVVTATEYMNFFGLRLDKAAQPEMRHLAHMMWVAYGESKPVDLKPGQWHLPFLGDEVIELLTRDEGENIKLAIKVSVARCARVSYQSFETGKRSTIEEDLRLYDRLVGSQPVHASPAEHQATPDECVAVIGEPDKFKCWNEQTWMNAHQHGNFKGWRQYRKMLEGEAMAPLPAEYQPKEK